MDKTEDKKIYEIGYLLAPYLPAEEISQEVIRSIKDKIIELTGEITSEIDPAMTRLAYAITKVIDNKHVKFLDGYFGALRFKVSSEAIIKLHTQWSKNNNLIRHLIISLPAGSENIIATKRSFAARREDQSFEIERLVPEKTEDKPVLSKEELDKEIDKLAV